MARHKDADWGLNNPVKTWDEVHAALLMDIRDEMRKLNNVFACWNFQQIPHTLKRIDRRLQVNMPIRKRKT